MGIFDRFKVIEGNNTDNVGPHALEVKRCIQALKQSNNEKNMFAFADALRHCVNDKEWVAMLACDEGEKGFRLDYRMRNGNAFVAWYTDPTEIKTKPDKSFSLLIADINKLLDPLFANKSLKGMIINPDTDGLCLTKGFILKLLLHAQYECQNNPGSAQRDWGEGIPRYTEADLMTREDFTNFALHIVIDYEIQNSGYRIESINDNRMACPNLILSKDDEYAFVSVYGYCAEKEPRINEILRRRLLFLGRRYNAKCYYAPVGVRSNDPLRFEKCIALKGDGFYVNFEGLREL